MERFSKETLRLLQEIEESTREILKEAEKELKGMSSQQKMELFGTDDVPFFDDPDWETFFPIGSEEDESEEF